MISCPICQSERIYRSHRHGWDWVLTIFFVLPYRCLDCRHRFYHYRFS